MVPIDTLPADVLGEIFHFASAEFLAMYSARNTICAVSHGWREIALSFPGLWTEVNINLAVCFPPVYLLRTWLQRSREALLDINIGNVYHLTPIQRTDLWQPTFPDSGPGDESTFPYAVSTLSVLVEHARRWKCFSYDFCSHIRGGTLLAIFPFQDAVQLVTLGMNISNIDCTTELDAFRAIAKLPNLREIHWRISDDSHLLTEGDLSWHRFKQVSLHCTTSQAAPIIAQCTSAVTMDCYLLASFPLQKEPQTKYSLHKLKVLRFSCQKDGFRLLRELDCPNLEVLGIGVID
jgi:hypothetical protein